MTLLRINKAVVSFGKRTILDGVTFSVKPKSIIALTGESGSGKTTLLGIISGLLKPDQGTVLYNDNNIFSWSDLQRSRYRNREIGYIFQSFNLIPDLNARQNILYPADINRLSGAIQEKVSYLIDFLKLNTIINQLPNSLSGGEKQRVAIARAIINWPKILLADEPTGNLDDKNGKNIFSLFEILKKEKNMSIIITTHDRFIIKRADTHYHLANGNLIKKK